MSLLSNHLTLVIPFVDTYVTAQNLLFVSTHCRTAFDSIEINPNYHTPVNRNGGNRYFCRTKAFLKLFMLFNNLSTIQLREGQVKFLNLIPPSIPFITLLKIDCQIKEIFHVFASKISSLSCYSFNASSINLDLLPNVKNVSIQTFCDSSLFDFFTNSNQSFDFVKIRMIGRVDIEFLSNLHMFNFGKCILQLSNQNLVKEVSNIENIFNYAIVVSDEWFDGIDDHVFILNEHEMKLHQSKDIDKLFLDLYFPSVIEFTGENTTPIDLTMFTQLQAINYSTTASFTPPTTLTILHDTFYLNIYDFPELKRLSLMTCNDIVDVPSTVTSLFCFYGDCQLNNLSCLKEISVGDVSVNFVDCISATRIDVLSLTTIQSSFSSLNQLLELCIPNATIPFPNTFYPTSLQSLFCSFSSLPQSLQITQLQLFVNDPVIVDLSQFIHLKDITFFTLYASSLTLPSSILNLSFQYESGPDLYSLDVSKYTTLTQIAFYGYQNKCTVSLPLNLSSLILDSSPQIIIPQLSLLSLCSLSISNQSFDFSKVTPTLKHFYFENHKIIHPHVYEQFNYLHLV